MHLPCSHEAVIAGMFTPSNHSAIRYDHCSLGVLASKADTTLLLRACTRRLIAFTDFTYPAPRHHVSKWAHDPYNCTPRRASPSLQEHMYTGTSVLEASMAPAARSVSGRTAELRG